QMEIELRELAARRSCRLAPHEARSRRQARCGRENARVSSGAIRELGRVLVDAGYDEEGITAALGGLDLLKARLLGDARPKSLDDPLAALVELFHVLGPVEQDRADAALAPVPTEALLEAGLLLASGDGVEARFQITPWLGLLVAHDRYDNAELRADF